MSTSISVFVYGSPGWYTVAALLAVMAFGSAVSGSSALSMRAMELGEDFSATVGRGKGKRTFSVLVIVKLVC